MILRIGFCFCSFVCLPALAIAQPVTEPAPKYAEAVKALEAYIAREVEDKKLTALSIALVDDQKIVWARGFGFADLAKKKPATADTVYRVGGISQLFTDIAVMQLVEQGKIDLDAPVTKYLPEFKPKNPFDTPITMRMLMAQRSGLVCEPPVGNHFDDSSPSLARTVASVNDTALVDKPDSTLRHSDAAVATAGLVLEKLQKQPFARCVREAILEPLGMKHSDFAPSAALKKDLAEAILWTYHGREFAAPTFDPGIAPAIGMYSTVNDLGRFMSALFAEGKPILKPATLKEMITPKLGERFEMGIGFTIRQISGTTWVGDNGSVHGFVCSIHFSPEHKLGAIVIAARDLSIALTGKIVGHSLQHLLAVKQGEALHRIMAPEPLKPDEAKKLAGRYRKGDRSIELVESAGRLWMFPEKGGFRLQLRKDTGQFLISDDVLGLGVIKITGDNKLQIGDDKLKRIAMDKPAPPKDHYRGLIGEYGPDHSVLYVYENNRKLYGTMDFLRIEPLKEIGKDEYAFSDEAFPFGGEKLIFKRDKNGKATEVMAGSVLFKRRQLDGEDGQTFRITPLKPVAELRQQALAAKPPDEKCKFRRSELVDVTTLDQTIKLDLRYATDNNFMSVPLYPRIAKAYMQKPAAEALAKVNAKLKKEGYGLLIHDAYRPWAVTKMFWEATPEKLRNFVADPAKGSRHNRGCAVDLTLYDLKTGKPVEMVSGFDEFSDRAYPDYIGGSSLQRWHRDLLRRSMEADDFTVYQEEWWHFDFKDWQQYAIGNQTFEELEKQ